MECYRKSSLDTEEKTEKQFLADRKEEAARASNLLHSMQTHFPATVIRFASFCRMLKCKNFVLADVANHKGLKYDEFPAF